LLAVSEKTNAKSPAALLQKKKTAAESTVNELPITGKQINFAPWILKLKPIHYDTCPSTPMCSCAKWYI